MPLSTYVASVARVLLPVRACTLMMVVVPVTVWVTTMRFHEPGL